MLSLVGIHEHSTLEEIITANYTLDYTSVNLSPEDAQWTLEGGKVVSPTTGDATLSYYITSPEIADVTMVLSYDEGVTPQVKLQEQYSWSDYEDLSELMAAAEEDSSRTITITKRMGSGNLTLIIGRSSDSDEQTEEEETKEGGSLRIHSITLAKVTDPFREILTLPEGAQLSQGTYSNTSLMWELNDSTALSPTGDEDYNSYYEYNFTLDTPMLITVEMQTEGDDVEPFIRKSWNEVSGLTPDEQGRISATIFAEAGTCQLMVGRYADGEGRLRVTSVTLTPYEDHRADILTLCEGATLQSVSNTDDSQIWEWTGSALQSPLASAGSGDDLKESDYYSEGCGLSYQFNLTQPVEVKINLDYTPTILPIIQKGYGTECLATLDSVNGGNVTYRLVLEPDGYGPTRIVILRDASLAAEGDEGRVVLRSIVLTPYEEQRHQILSLPEEAELEGIEDSNESAPWTWNGSSVESPLASEAPESAIRYEIYFREITNVVVALNYDAGMKPTVTVNGNEVSLSATEQPDGSFVATATCAVQYSSTITIGRTASEGSEPGEGRVRLTSISTIPVSKDITEILTLAEGVELLSTTNDDGWYISDGKLQSTQVSYYTNSLISYTVQLAQPSTVKVTYTTDYNVSLGFRLNDSYQAAETSDSDPKVATFKVNAGEQKITINAGAGWSSYGYARINSVEIVPIDEGLDCVIDNRSEYITDVHVASDVSNPWTANEDGSISTNCSSGSFTTQLNISLHTSRPAVVKFDGEGTLNNSSIVQFIIDDESYGVYRYGAGNTFNPEINLNEGDHSFVIKVTHNYGTDQSFTLHKVILSTLGDDYLTVHVSQAGTLSDEILAAEGITSLDDVENLRVTGTLNADDWTTLKNLANLTCLDLEGTDATEIPDNAFRTHSNLKLIAFPAATRRIGTDALALTNLLGTLTLPQTLEEIGEGAFGYCNLLTSCTLPESVTTLGKGAFRSCDALEEFHFNAATTIIPEDFLNSCNKLTTVGGTENVVEVESGAFYTCEALTDIGQMAPIVIGSSAFANCDALTSIPLAQATTIGYSAFSGCEALESVALDNIEQLGESAFNGCTKLSSATVGDKLQTISSYAFANCSKLRNITFGSSTTAVEYNAVGNNKDLISLTINAAMPPTATYVVLTPGNVTLYVPAFAIPLYQAHSYWSLFKSIQASDVELTDIRLYDALEMESDVRMGGTPNLTIAWPTSGTTHGAWTVNGEAEQTLGHFQLHLRAGAESPAIINNEAAITSQQTTVTYHMQAGRWYYLCMPFDVRRADIELAGDNYLAVRTYDGALRAQQGSGQSWQDVADDATLQAGQGYIFAVSAEDDVRLPATQATRDAIFANQAITTPLEAHESNLLANAGWNLIGNPYAAYYDISQMDYDAPITRWDAQNGTYQAYSAQDDALALEPLEAFFVQKPQRVAEISFQPAGRQLNSEVSQENEAPAMERSLSSRQVWDLTLSNGRHADRTRLVRNPEASDAFEAETDAAKLLGEGAIQLYTIQDGIRYAINEGAQQRGLIPLGMQLGQSGEFTLRATRQTEGIQLLDRGERVPLPYTFTAQAGTTENRFQVLITDLTDGLHMPQVDEASSRTYDLSGRRVTTPQRRGIYIENGIKKVK